MRFSDLSDPICSHYDDEIIITYCKKPATLFYRAANSTSPVILGHVISRCKEHAINGAAHLKQLSSEEFEELRTIYMVMEEW